MGYAEKEEYAEDTGKKEKSAAESPMSYICHMGWGGALTACLADEYESLVWRQRLGQGCEVKCECYESN